MGGGGSQDTPPDHPAAGGTVTVVDTDHVLLPQSKQGRLKTAPKLIFRQPREIALHERNHLPKRNLGIFTRIFARLKKIQDAFSIYRTHAFAPHPPNTGGSAQ
jgi:hypothetical protein